MEIWKYGIWKNMYIHVCTTTINHHQRYQRERDEVEQLHNGDERKYIWKEESFILFSFEKYE